MNLMDKSHDRAPIYHTYQRGGKKRGKRAIEEKDTGVELSEAVRNNNLTWL